MDTNLGCQVRQILTEQGGIEILEPQYEAISVYHQNNYLPLLCHIYAKNRAMFFRLLHRLQIESATQDSSLTPASLTIRN